MYFIDLFNKARCRIMSWYLILYLVLFLSCRPPAYTGRNNLIELTETSFRRRVRDATAVVDGGDGGDKKAVSWLVFLYADWQKNSHWHLPMFAKLSLQFASPKLRFGKLDLSRHPGVAADCNIDVGARSKQLPSMILFTGGRERARLPDFRSDGSVINTIIDERGSIAFFHLEQEFGLQNSGHRWCAGECQTERRLSNSCTSFRLRRSRKSRAIR